MVCALLLLLFSACGKREARPPNIIFVLTDDHRWDALGVMGNPIIRTPNIDSLAHHGLLFRNAYVTTAICAVSRASILTGQYESRHHVNDFNTSMTPEALQQTYPVLLRNAGYQVGFIGKYGVGRPKDQPKEQFDFWECSPKGQPDYELKDENGNYLHHTDKVDRDITRFLNQVDKEKPFCLSVSFKAPHVQDNDPRQFIIHPRYKKYYENDVIPTPETADPKYWEQFPDFFRTDENIARARWQPRLSTPELYQGNVKNYYRLLTQVDDVVGHLMKQLSELGMGDNTIVIFAGDNGLFLGEHGLTGKWYEYQESIRVPLIVFDPRDGNRMDGKVVDRIALNIDVAPTILDYAGVRIPEAMQGVDLLHIADGTADRKDFFYEHTFMGSPGIPKVEGVVSRKFSYMKYIEHDYEELYNLTKDPLEEHNLAKDTAYREELANLRSRYEELKKKVQ
jgi:arylsulfatase A-like enzyme